MMNPTRDIVPGTRRYDAYGSHHRDPADARTGYAGEVGEADLPWYLLGNRFYIPSLRQFASPDKASPFNAGGLNRYAYCGGDPINRIDPTGESFWDYLGAALGIVGAAIGVAATGGALLGVLGAAAAGSLTASLSTTTMVAMTAATVLETVSIVAEVGSIASLAANDQRAAGIFGWVGLGAGLASPGVGALGKRAARVSFGAHPRDLSRPRLVSTEGAGTGSKTIVSYGTRFVRQVIALQGEDALPDAVRARIVTRYERRRVQPLWMPVSRPQGTSVHWVTQEPVTTIDVEEQVMKIVSLGEPGRITLITAVHGSPLGANWANKKRLMGSPEAYKGAQGVRDRVLAATGKQIRLVNASLLDTKGFKQLLARPGTFIHGFCCSMADAKTMKEFNMSEVTTHRLT